MQEIDVSSNDEIVLGETLDGVGGERYADLAPGDAEIRMMPLLFRYLPYFVRKRERFRKIIKRIRTRELRRIF